MKQIFKNVGFYILSILILFAIFYPFISKFRFDEMDLNNSYVWSYASILGRDSLGRDVLTRIAVGLRVSFMLSFVALLLEGILGVGIGSYIGYFNNKTSKMLFLLLKFLSSIPPIFVITLLISFFMKSNIWITLFALSFNRWIPLSLIVRSEVLKISGYLYVLNSRLFGARFSWILFKHILPNIQKQLIYRLTLSISRSIFYESALTFIGIGLQPPMVSLGRLMLEGFREIYISPYLFCVYTFFMFLTMISLNFIANIFIAEED